MGFRSLSFSLTRDVSLVLETSRLIHTLSRRVYAADGRNFFLALFFVLQGGVVVMDITG